MWQDNGPINTRPRLQITPKGDIFKKTAYAVAINRTTCNEYCNR